MKKLFITLGVIGILACTSIAHSVHYQAHKPYSNKHSYQQDCQIELTSDIRITPANILFHNNSIEIYEIKSGELYIKGQKQALSSKQSDIVQQYEHDIRALIPDIKNVAMTGVDMATTAVDVLNVHLFDGNNNATNDLGKQLNRVKQNLITKFDVNNQIDIDQDGDFIKGVLGEDFEQKFESSIEAIIEKSIGSVVQNLLFSGDVSTIETKMENFGRQMENSMEQRAKVIEQQAELLCKKARAVAKLELAIQNSVPQMSGLGVIHLR